MKPKTKKEWDEFGKNLIDKVMDAVDEFCSMTWSGIGEPTYKCYESLAYSGLYELVQQFVEEEELPEDFLRLLDEMPDDIYKKYDRLLQRKLEKAAREEKVEHEEALRSVFGRRKTII